MGVAKSMTLRGGGVLLLARHNDVNFSKNSLDMPPKSMTISVCRPNNTQNRYKLGKNVNMRSFALEEVRHSL